MATRMLIDATHDEETRVAIVKGNRVEDFDFESANKKQLKGNIYLAKVTRVEPSLQAAFVDYGGNRHGFLAFSEIHPDYYQIPIADREALLEEEAKLLEQYAQKQLEAEADAQAKTDEGKEEDQDTDSAPATAAEDASAPAVTSAVEDARPVDDSSAHANNDGQDPEAASAGHDEDKAGYNDSSNDQNNGKADVTKGDATSEDDSTEEVTEDIDDLNTDEDEREIIRTVAADRLRRRYKIQEVIKKNQILLIQVVKEERGNKGAALTTYLSLPGRYCVLMPNTFHGGGVSRKISSPQDRKKLKSVLAEMNMPEGMACIIRTAGKDRTRTEIKRDYDYLNRMWEDIRESTLSSIAPALIYEEGDLVKRSIRDLYSRDIDEVLVDGEPGYKNAKAYMKMLMPSHARNVKHYSDNIPLFHRYQVESQLDSMYSPEVHMRSGGYIVINPTEALISIDVNSGRSTKEHNIEETAVKTNLEAAEEIARQLRLRDMAGLVVIDFIDMDDRNNNRAVERKLKECLKSDRARIQVGRISSFGLLEMSRQRLRPGMLEASTRPCPHCEGTGIIRTIDSAALYVLRAIEEEGIRKRSSNILVKVSTDVAIYLLNKKRRELSDIEQRYSFSVGISTDDNLTVPNFIMERDGQTIDHVLGEDTTPVASDPGRQTQQSRDIRTEDNDNNEDGKGNRRRKRKKRNRRRDSDDNATQNDNDNQNSDQTVTGDDRSAQADSPERSSEDDDDNQDGNTKRRRRRGKRGGRRRTRGGEEQQQNTENPENTDNIGDGAPDDNVNIASSTEGGHSNTAVPGDTEDKPASSTDEKPRRRRNPRRRRRPQSTQDDNTTHTDDSSATSSAHDAPVASETAKKAESETDGSNEHTPARRRPPRKRNTQGDKTESKVEQASEVSVPSSQPATEAPVSQPSQADTKTDTKVEKTPTAEPPAKPRKGWWQKALGN
ncbi:MAG: ribonuclease [Kordiimonas sp.]|nr:ribonuclease [Kordiimonas sp.]